MQAAPPDIPDHWAQPGTDADSDTKVQCNNPQSHPQWSIMACEWNEYFAPAKAGKGINPNG
jgi:hypothetical protein